MVCIFWHWVLYFYCSCGGLCIWLSASNETSIKEAYEREGRTADGIGDTNEWMDTIYNIDGCKWIIQMMCIKLFERAVPCLHLDPPSQ